MEDEIDLFELLIKLCEGKWMQPNLYKVIYYQWLSDALSWKAVPKAVPINGPTHWYY